MIIQIDTREKQKAISKIISEFDRCGVTHVSSKLYVGDYVNMAHPMLVVDRKQNLNELCSNVVQDHDRFIREIERANAVGIHIVFLVEHSSKICVLQDVMKWKNPRLKNSPLAVSGERLYKILSTIKGKYGVDFQFCDKDSTGRRIMEILKNDD